MNKTKWTDRLDARQSAEVRFARAYVQQVQRATARRNRLRLIGLAAAARRNTARVGAADHMQLIALLADLLDEAYYTDV